MSESFVLVIQGSNCDNYKQRVNENHNSSITMERENVKFQILLVLKVPESHCSLKLNLWLKLLQKRENFHQLDHLIIKNSLCERQMTECKLKMECNAYQTDNMFDYTVSQHKNKAIDIFLSCFRYTLPPFPLTHPILELSQRKVIPKIVGKYTTFRYTVQFPICLKFQSVSSLEESISTLKEKGWDGKLHKIYTCNLHVCCVIVVASIK